MARAGGGALKWATVTAYVVFGLLVFVVALALTFPLEPAVGRLTALAAARTGWTVDVAGPRLTFPPGLAAREVTGTGPKGQQVALDAVRVRLAPWGLKDGAVVVDHDVDGYGGHASGRLEVEDAFQVPGYRWRGQVRGVALEKLPPPPPDVPVAPWAQGYKVSGSLDLDAKAGWRGDDFARGEGDGSLTLTGLTVVLPRTPAGALTLPFGDVRGQARWQRGRLEVQEMTIECDLVRGRGSGQVMLGRTPQVSRLDLRFTGTLEGGFPMRDMVVAVLNLKDGQVTITVKGTVARPLVFVNGKPVDRLLAGGA
jgi:type II secretion system protein N